MEFLKKATVDSQTSWNQQCTKTDLNVSCTSQRAKSNVTWAHLGKQETLMGHIAAYLPLLFYIVWL